MTTLDSIPESPDGAPRRRGAPEGNRNAWKHGGRSAAAKAAREAARARIAASLPSPGAVLPSLAFANSAYARLRGVSEPAGEGGARFSGNKTNNSLAREGTRKRGAPKGNKNALKHGMDSARRLAVDADLRNFRRRVLAIAELAVALAEAEPRSAP